MTSTTPVDLTQVDAFSERPFSGNPAAVCLLSEPRDDDWMQSVAAEMNLAETAFLVRRAAGGYDLRWFTPLVEVDLCGHATLASAHVLWEQRREDRAQPLQFYTRSGRLTALCRRDDGIQRIEMDFPSQAATACEAPEGLLEPLHLEATDVQWVGRNSTDYLVALASEEAVRHVAPNFGRLAQVPARGVIVTAQTPDADYDFVSRFFAPAAGIDEDPVTGSAHCCLGPYWTTRVGTAELIGYQASRRGGFVGVRVARERVWISGRAVSIFRTQLIC